MITIDFDTAEIPANSSNASCIVKCKGVRLNMTGVVKTTIVKNDELMMDDEFNGSISLQDLGYKNFLVMVNTIIDNGSEYGKRESVVYDARSIVLLPKGWKDWTGTLEHNRRNLKK